MAWTYEQKFDGLTDGTLNGQDSYNDNGTGSAFPVVGTSNPAEGTKALYFQGGTTRNAYRAITAVTDGTFYVSLRGKKAVSDSGVFGMILYDGSGTVAMQWALQLGTNNIGIWNNAGTQDSGFDFVDDVYTRIGIRFDCGTDLYSMNQDNGTFTSDYSFVNAVTSIAKIRLWFGLTPDNDGYMDNISPNYSDVSTSVKDIIGGGTIPFAR